jgi:hypothetical protein
LQSLSDHFIEGCFKDALSFISRIFLEVLLNPEYVKEYNYYAIENLKMDIDALDNYFNDINVTFPGFNECLTPIKLILQVFILRKYDVFFDKSKSIESIFDVKIERLMKFFIRYKNLKKSADMKGKISETDIATFIKKVRESYGLVHK